MNSRVSVLYTKKPCSILCHETELNKVYILGYPMLGVLSYIIAICIMVFHFSCFIVIVLSLVISG